MSGRPLQLPEWEQRRDGAVLHLPVRPPKLWLASPRWGWRLLAWAVLLGVAGLVVATGSTFFDGHTLHKGASYAWWFPYVLLLLVIVLFIAPLLAMLLVAICAMSAEHRTVVVDRHGVTERYRSGPCRWRRRTNLFDIDHLLVRPPPTMLRKDLLQPRSEQPVIVVMKRREEQSQRRLWAGQLPQAAALQLAQGLAQQLERARAAAGRPARRGLAVVDATDPSWLNSDDTTPPPGNHLRVERRRQRTTISDPPADSLLATFIRTPTCRAGLWGILILIAACFALPLLPPEIQLKKQPLLLSFLMIGGLHLALVVAGLSEAARRTTYIVDDQSLQKLTRGLLWQRIQRWPREKLRSVQVVYRIGDQNRYSPVLQLQLADDKRVQFRYRHVEPVRFLAAVLRDALQLRNGAAEVPAADPADPQWDVQDQLQAPEKNPFHITMTANGLLAQRNAKGFTRRYRIFLSVASACLIAAGGVAVAGVHLAHTADDRHVAYFFTGLLAIYGLALLLATLYDALVRFDVVLDDRELIVKRYLLWGMGGRRWRREEIAAIHTRPWLAGNPKPGVFVIVVGRHGRQRRAFSADPPEGRYLATLLRRSIGVPATSALAPAEVSSGSI